MARRRIKGEGAIYQRHTSNCPPPNPDGTRRTHTCDGLWVASIDGGWVNGRRDRRYIAGKTKKAVAAKLQKARADAATGVHTDTTTLKAWMTYWLDEVAEKSTAPSTMRTYRSYVENWIGPLIGRKRLDKVTPVDIRALHKHIAAAGRAPATVRQVHSILRRALQVAYQDGRISENPAARVDSPALTDSHHDALTTDESLVVLAAASGARERARTFVSLLTGLRQGEALGLDWLDVHDLDSTDGMGSMWIHQVAQSVTGEGMVLLERTKRGAGKGRWVALIPEVTAALREWRDESGGQGLVFGDGQTPIRPEPDHRAWKKLCARAGVPLVPLHGARASTATRLLELGVPPHVVAAILGHADLAITMSRYSRTTLDSQRSALAGLAPLALPAAPLELPPA